jgi:16S rRNA processing protein RimM
MVVLGVITRAHGIRGELRVRCHNPDSDLLESLDSVTLRHTGAVTDHQVIAARAVPGAYLVTLSDVNDRTAAERLAGAEVCVPRSALPPLPAGEYYHVDLIGLRVRSRTDETLGRVTRVIDYPAAECLEVEGHDGGVREVPMAAPYLVAVDVADGCVTVGEWDDLAAVPSRRR